MSNVTNTNQEQRAVTVGVYGSVVCGCADILKHQVLSLVRREVKWKEARYWKIETINAWKNKRSFDFWNGYSTNQHPLASL